MWALMVVVAGACGSATGRSGEGPAPPTAAKTTLETTSPPAPEPIPDVKVDPALAQWREALAAARGRQLERLARYAAARNFPRNHVALGRVPVFVDPDGTHCAVGYLMRESGHGALVDQIARDDNLVRIEDVADGPLNEWILRSGLLREEAALIQPAYSWETANGGGREEEVERLVDHFARVDALLRRTTEDSLTLALERLGPAIAAGETIDAVAR